MTKRKPRGYWESLDNTIAEAQQAMEKHKWGTLPAKNILEKHGYSSLTTAIQRYYGGMQTFRTTLGQQNERKPRGYWEKEENTIVEALRAMQEQNWDTLPSQNELAKHGYHSLTNSIGRHHGGIQHFRTKLGQTNTKKPQGYWQKLENTIKEAQQIMQTRGWTTLPSKTQLEKQGCSSLSTAINTYHGGFHTFRKLLTQQITGKTQKQQLEELLDEYIAA